MTTTTTASQERQRLQNTTLQSLTLLARQEEIVAILPPLSYLVLVLYLTPDEWVTSAFAPRGSDNLQRRNPSMRALTLLLTTLLCVASDRLPAAETEVTGLIRQLDFKQPRAERIAAAKRLNQICTRAQAAIPTLKRSVKQDPDPQVRIEALSMIVYQNKKTRQCPIEIFHAWEDKNWEVRGWARTYTHMFILRKDNRPDGKLIAHFPKQATGLLLRCANDADADQRASAVLMLGYLANDHPGALAVIQKARQDKNWWVRDSAHYAVLQATGDIEGFWRYNVVLLAQLLTRKPLTREDYAKLPESEKVQVRKNLKQLGIPLAFGKDVGKHPQKIARVLHALLRDRSAQTRLAAVRFLGHCWAMPEAPQSVLEGPTFLPFGQGKKPRKEPKIPPGTWLRKHGLHRRLKELRKDDADAAVRQEAQIALKKIASGGK